MRLTGSCYVLAPNSQARHFLHASAFLTAFCETAGPGTRRCLANAGHSPMETVVGACDVGLFART